MATLTDVERQARVVIGAVVVGATATAVGLTVMIGVTGWSLGVLQPEVRVTVVNVVRVSVDLTCPWDNREDLRPGHRIHLPVEAGDIEDCSITGHAVDRAFGCLELDGRGSAGGRRIVRVSSARQDVDCSI